MEDTNMMLDCNEYRKQLAAGVKQVGQLSPDTVKAYVELSSAGSKKNLEPLMLFGIIRALRRRTPDAADTRRSVERAFH
jgi:hypothetical protein